MKWRGLNMEPDVTYKELMAGIPSGNGRYLKAEMVGDADVHLQLAPEGYCQWCGKELPKRCRRFCPGVIVGPPLRSEWQYKTRRCANSYFVFWYSIQRFRRAVFIRDKFTCKICGVAPTRLNLYGLVLPDLDKLAIDHIHPFSKGGKTIIKNLQVACRPCNGKKGSKLN